MGESADTRLAPDDAALLAVESDSILGHTLKLLMLEPASGPLAVDELRELVGARLDRVPAARRRVETDEAGPRWVEAESVDLSAHVAEHRLGGEGEEDLWRAAAELMATRLDHTRPLWTLHLVDPLADGRQAIVARIHHALADGVSSMRMLEGLLWDLESDADPDHGARHSPPGGSEHRGLTGELLHLPAALWRELVSHRSPSPFDRRIGATRAIAFTSMPLEELRALGHSLPGHVTVNDILLGSVAGGIRRWLEGTGDRLGEVRAQIPVSLHHRSEKPDELGNRDSFLNVSLPLAEPDPLRRLEMISAETSKRKRLGDAEELYSFFHALAFAPAIARRVGRLARSPREFALAISNVPGPASAVRIAGRRVERLGSVAEPAERHALRVSAVSCAGTVTVGVCTDPEALPGVEQLASEIEAGFRELREAASR